MEKTVSAQEPVQIGLSRSIHLVPMDHVDGFDIRPGLYEINGATAIPGGVNFTVHSKGAETISSTGRRTSPTP